MAVLKPCDGGEYPRFDNPSTHLDAVATTIAALHHDNTLLRQERHRTGDLITLDDHRTIPPICSS
ncbi:hypothetical protein [Nocardia sp. NPDC003183]